MKIGIFGGALLILFALKLIGYDFSWWWLGLPPLLGILWHGFWIVMAIVLDLGEPKRKRR